MNAGESSLSAANTVISEAVCPSSSGQRYTGVCIVAALEQVAVHGNSLGRVLKRVTQMYNDVLRLSSILTLRSNEGDSCHDNLPRLTDPLAAPVKRPALWS